jgi:hypothetical protein
MRIRSASTADAAFQRTGPSLNILTGQRFDITAFCSDRQIPDCEDGRMILRITGASPTGKSLPAQQMPEKYKCPISPSAPSGFG